MFSRILVPLDGSQLAEWALPYAEELAGAFNSEVTLIYVCQPAENQYRHMHQLYIKDIARMVKKHIKPASPVATVKPVILDGEAAAEIIDYARENDISLIVMVTHGRSGIMPWAMGSITHKVLQRISVPILLIRARVAALKPEREEKFSKILVPLDGSGAGEAALPYVEELAKKLKPEVIFLNVVLPGQHVHTIGGLNYVPFPEHEIQSLKAEAKQYLETVSRKLERTKATTRCEVKIGNAAQEIIKFAEETDTRLVAMSTHGRSSIGQWIFGSVTHKVLHAGSTPILVVRASGQ